MTLIRGVESLFMEYKLQCHHHSMLSRLNCKDLVIYISCQSTMFYERSIIYSKRIKLYIALKRKVVSKEMHHSMQSQGHARQLGIIRRA